MATRNADLENLLAALEAALKRAAEPGSGVATAIDEASRRWRTAGAPETPPTDKAPVYACFDAAVAGAVGTDAEPVAKALATVAPELAWRTRPDRESDDPNFSKAHANAVLVGEGGLENRSDLRIGVSLLAPNTFYPNHRHPPEEVYVALSPGDWRQNEDAWMTPGPGGLVHNPPNIWHSMRSGPAPLLAIWTLLMDGPSPPA